MKLLKGFVVLITLSATAFTIVISPTPSLAVLVSPETLCAGTGSQPLPVGGIASFEEFMQRFAGRFKSDQEARRAWRVYLAVNRTDATVVIGRLADTASYVRKSGYCVLSDLPDWTVAINDVFIYGATDRAANFLSVSAIPQEIMAGGDRINPQQVEKDRETYWRVIYNHEIHVIVGTGKYRLPKDFKPPMHLASAQPPVRAQGSVGGGVLIGLAGTWKGQGYDFDPAIATIGGGGATTDWRTPGHPERTVQETWSNCTPKNEGILCSFSSTYIDEDKTTKRQGKLVIRTLSPNKISVHYEVDPSTCKVTWHPGKAPYGSATCGNYDIEFTRER